MYLPFFIQKEPNDLTKEPNRTLFGSLEPNRTPSGSKTMVYATQFWFIHPELAVFLTHLDLQAQKQFQHGSALRLAANPGQRRQPVVRLAAQRGWVSAQLLSYHEYVIP